MSKKSVAIIGFGWLGKPLALALKEDGHTVFASSRNDDKITEINDLGITGFKITFGNDNVEVDLNFALIQEIDFLIITLPPSGFEIYTESMTQISSKFSSKTKIIFTSSTGVYRDTDSIIDETGAVIKNHPVYLAEQKLREVAKKRLTILRLAGLIGMNRHPVKYFIQKNVIPTGSSPVNLVRGEDVIRAIIDIIEKDLIGEVFNIVSKEHPDRVAYYSTAAKSIFDISLCSEKQTPGKTIDGMKFVKNTRFNYKYSIFEWDAFYKKPELT
jgi:nucleoside-diphosphate-sugar epimerase